MSRSDAKFPGLGELAKANGLNYLTALNRAKRGWPVQYAGSIPVGQSCPGFIKKKSGPQKRPAPIEVGVPYTPPVNRALPWDRPGWVKSLRPVVVRKKYVPKGRIAKGSAPSHIRVLREALCAEFLATGNLNVDTITKLKEYADAFHRLDRRAKRVPAEPQAEDVFQGRTPLRSDGVRDDHQPPDPPA